MFQPHSYTVLSAFMKDSDLLNTVYVGILDTLLNYYHENLDQLDAPTVFVGLLRKYSLLGVLSRNQQVFLSFATCFLLFLYSRCAPQFGSFLV